MFYTATIGSRTISSEKQVIVLFSNGEFLEFDDATEARHFAAFYNTNKAAMLRTPVRIYLFQAGEWVEDAKH